MTFEELLREYNFELLTHMIASNTENNKFKDLRLTTNIMIKNAYTWKATDLIEKIITYDKQAYVYLLGLFIRKGYNNQFKNWFTKYHIDWDNELAVIKWFLLLCIKSGNNNICNYIINNCSKIDLCDNNYYIDYICTLDDIDLYPRCNVLFPFIKHMKIEDEKLCKTSLYTLECIYRYEGVNTPSARFLFCALKKRQIEEENRWKHMFEHLFTN